MFNLTRPDKSILLLAPLSEKAGGLGLCRETLKPEAESGKDEPNPLIVFADASDDDYQAMLKHIAAGKKR